MTERSQCRGCHRALKRPSPTGYGPTCARRRGLTPTRRRGLTPTRRKTASRRPKPAPVPPAPDALPGQTELDLYAHQPTLWSI